MIVVEAHTFTYMQTDTHTYTFLDEERKRNIKRERKRERERERERQTEKQRKKERKRNGRQVCRGASVVSEPLLAFGAVLSRPTAPRRPPQGVTVGAIRPAAPRRPPQRATVGAPTAGKRLTHNTGHWYLRMAPHERTDGPDSPGSPVTHGIGVIWLCCPHNFVDLAMESEIQ